MHQIQLELLYLIHSANIYPRPTVYWHADYMDLHQKDIMPPPMEFTLQSYPTGYLPKEAMEQAEKAFCSIYRCSKTRLERKLELFVDHP